MFNEQETTVWLLGKKAKRNNIAAPKAGGGGGLNTLYMQSLNNSREGATQGRLPKKDGIGNGERRGDTRAQISNRYKLIKYC